MKNIKDVRLMQEKLKQAQSLLSDVYHYACEEGIDFVERSMSAADDCIIESKDWLGNIEEQLIDDASWRV